ncbi:MAG: hypothetical protein AB7I18_12220 [Candidatus Berkiella sp.]
MTVFSIDKLMQETRRLATQYRQSTGQTLPVSGELARYDATRLLHLTSEFKGTQGPLAHKVVQIKSRVIFDDQKSGYRIGQLDLDGGWQMCALVLYESNYEPFVIYIASREIIVESLNKSNLKTKARGAMSLAQFKRIAQCVWTIENGLNWDEVLSNVS